MTTRVFSGFNPIGCAIIAFFGALWIFLFVMIALKPKPPEGCERDAWGQVHCLRQLPRPRP